MKYEAVFGNQDLFDGASEFVEVIRFNDYSRDYLWGDLNTIQLLTFEELKAIPIVAMRRIIAEPKRWTLEDKKAGRLPDVGGVVMVPSIGERASVAAINNDAVCVVFHDGEFTTLHKSGISPLETPEEKSERLRAAWVELAFDNMMRKEGPHSTECLDRIKCHFGSAYDALLSGALSAPTKGGE